MAAATSMDGSSLHAPFVRPLAAAVDGAAPSGLLSPQQQHHQLAYGAPPMQSHGMMYSLDHAAMGAMGGAAPGASSPDAIDALAVATTQYSPPAASLPNALGMQMASQQLHPQSQLVAMDGPTFALHSQQLLTTLEPMGAAPFAMHPQLMAAQHMAPMQQQQQPQQQHSFAMQPVDAGYMHPNNGFNAAYSNALAAQQQQQHYHQQQLMMLHAQQQQHQQQQEMLALQQQQQQLQLQASLAHSNPLSPSHLTGGGRTAHVILHDPLAKRPPPVSTPNCARSSPRSSVNYKESTPEALYQPPSQCYSPLTSTPKTFAFPGLLSGLYTTAISKLHSSPHVSPAVSPFAPATASTSVAHLYSKANMNGITPHPHPQHVQPLPSLHQLPQQTHYAVAAEQEEEEAPMDEGEGGEEEMEEEPETPHANLGDLLSAARGLDSQTKKARKQKARKLAEAAAELQAPAPKKRKSLPEAPVAAPVVIAHDNAAPAPVDDLPPPAPIQPSKQRRERAQNRESRKDRPAKPTVVAEDTAPVAAPAAVAAPVTVTVPSPRSKAPSVPASPVLTGISTTPSTPPHAPKERQTRTSRLAASSDAVEELARELAAANAANKSAHKPKKHTEEDAAAPGSVTPLADAVKGESRAAVRLEADDTQMKDEPVPAVSSQPSSPRKSLPSDASAVKPEPVAPTVDGDAGVTEQAAVVDAVKPEHEGATTGTIAAAVDDVPTKAEPVARPTKRSHKKKLPPPGSESAPPLIPAERVMPLRVRSSRGKDESPSSSAPSALPPSSSAVPSSTSSSSASSRASSPPPSASKGGGGGGGASGEASASTPEEKDATEAARLAELRKAEAANERYMRQYLELYAAERAFGSTNSRTRHQATVNASPADAVLHKKGRAKVVEFNANSAKRAAAKEMRAVAAQQLRDRAAKEQEESAAAAAADRESTASGNTANAALVPSTTSPATSVVGSSASGASSSRQRSRASGRSTGGGGGGEVREVAATSSRSKSSRKSVSDDEEAEEQGQGEKGGDADGSDSDSSDDSSSSSESSEEEEDEEPKPKKRLSELDRLHLANQSIFAAEEKARRKALRKQHKAAARAAAAAAAAATPTNAKIDGGASTEAAQPSGPPAAAAAAAAAAPITAPVAAPKRKR